MTDRIEQPIGDALDGLGITAHIPPGTLIAGAVVILKTVAVDGGGERIGVAFSQGLGVAERIGMLHIAETAATTTAAGRQAPGA